jgi:hypothetical protein
MVMVMVIVSVDVLVANETEDLSIVNWGMGEAKLEKDGCWEADAVAAKRGTANKRTAKTMARDMLDIGRGNFYSCRMRTDLRADWERWAAAGKGSRQCT